MKTYHDELNPKLWNKEDLKPEVADKLRQIAKAFIESLEVPVEAIKDIVITGSSASYNYTPQSDIDLHLIVDFEKVHKDCPIVGEYLLSKKSEFNNNHDIYIYGIPVEVYAESIDNNNVHNGLYSLKGNKWIDKPQKLKPTDNDIAVNAKYKEFAEAAKNVADGDVANELIQKIKKMRKAGLEKAGEFSVENLVFKKLRNEGVIGKLMDIRKEEEDKELSLEEAYESLITSIEEMINTTASVMAPYPVNVIGRPVSFTKIKSEKGGRGEKRAPHTEVKIAEEYEKQSKGKESPAMYKYSYKKNGKLRKMNIEEPMLEIAAYCGAISEATLYTGHREGDGSKEYKVRTTHDSGKFETKVRANSPEEARKMVQKMHGGPDSAHEVVESFEENEMDIFENLENLNVSEECFDEIMNMVEELLQANEGIASKIAPALAGEGKKQFGREESMGTKIERAGVKHPYIMKAARGIDNVAHKVDTALRKKEPKYKSAEDALKTMKPAGSIYGKDMYSDGQVELAKKMTKEKVPTNKYIWQK